MRRTTVERALPRRDLFRPTGRAARRCGRLRRHGCKCGRGRRARRRRSEARLAGVFVGRGAALGDDLIEPLIEPRQCVRNAIRSARVGGHRDGRGGRRWCAWGKNRRRRALGNRRRLREASLRHALELPRQVVETVMHRREVIAVLVLGVVPI